MSAGRVLQGVSYAQGGSVCRKAGCARARSIASARPPRNGERGADAAAAQPRERWSSADTIDLDSPPPPGGVRSAARARPAEDSSPAPRCRRRHTLEDSSDDERAGAAPAGCGRARGGPETAAMGRGGAAAATDDGGAAAMAVDAPEGAAAGHRAAAAAANGPEAAAAGGDGPGPRDAPRAAQPAGLAELAAAAAAGAALHARVPRCRIATLTSGLEFRGPDGAPAAEFALTLAVGDDACGGECDAAVSPALLQRTLGARADLHTRSKPSRLLWRQAPRARCIHGLYEFGAKAVSCEAAKQ